MPRAEIAIQNKQFSSIIDAVLAGSDPKELHHGRLAFGPFTFGLSALYSRSNRKRL